VRTGAPHFLTDVRGPVAALKQAGLLVGGPYSRPELPREVAAMLALDGSPPVIGRPALRPSTDSPTDGGAGAEAAVRALVSLLDEAAAQPLARLKKGGIGARERARLVKRLGIDEPALWIDLAAALDLLDLTDTGYAAAEPYARWRDKTVASRWAGMALAWFALDLAPTSRETDDGEVAPPVELVSGGGLLRRAWLRAAAEGRSLAAAADQIDWFAPLHGYDDTGRARKIAAARCEAELLGVVAGDRLTALGELLVAEADAEALAARATELLPDTRGLLVVQSDLTALVSGQPTAAVARLLAASAVSEGRGAAAVWRFTPASVRSALDAGWTVDELRSELVEASGRPLPQPVDYLFADVARRHGSVRARAACTCLTGTEAEITEIAHTRGVAKLRLTQVAPTVLTSPLEVDVVLAGLRAAGFSPVPVGADGTVVVPDRPAARPRSARRARERGRVEAAVLAARLVGATGPTRPRSPVYAQVAELAQQLDPGEVALLADAIEHERDVHIRYRNKDGNRSVRDIAPVRLVDRWVQAWCYLRSGEREFALRGIESVGPATGRR
jgi:Helicase conserved C-terminal domain/WYL domain